MGLPASLLTDLSELGKAAESRPPGEAELAALSAKEELLAIMAQLAAQTARLQKSADGILSQLDRLAADLAPEDLEGMDEVVDQLQRAEGRLRETLANSQVKRSRDKMFTLRFTWTSSEKARVIATLDRFVEVAKRHADLLRDARWRLMALRAKLEDPGDAPVFSDPDQLLKYLGSR
jgi:hypothetical protein